MTNPVMKSAEQNDAPQLKVILGIFGVSLLVSGVVIFFLLNNVLQLQPRNVLDEREVTGVRPISPAREVQDFTLPAHTGNEVALSDLRGEPVLLYFGYTHCPDVCLLTLNDVMDVHELLGEQGDDLSYAFISVDGQRDTPEILARYVAQRGVDDYLLGMSGDDITLAQISNDYGLFYELLTDEADEYGNYTVNHTASLYLIDAEGRLNTIFAYGTDPALIAERIAEEL